jgi:hypothetical protein
MAKITLTYEGETLSYSDDAKKVVTVSFENPKNVSIILQEITGFLKASGYPIGDNQHLVLGYDKPEPPNSGISFRFDEFDDERLNGIRHLKKSYIGPEDC